jgi:hypothetical protein
MLSLAPIALSLTLATAGAFQPRADVLDLRGAWQPETYLLKDGARHAVDGLIFFTERDWTVLFFVKDAEGQPRRGSAEGGTYTLAGDKLVFTHKYNLSAGSALAGLPESPLRMRVAEGAAASNESCTIEIDGDRLTIRFTSGNAMTFRRRSG